MALKKTLVDLTPNEIFKRSRNHLPGYRSDVTSETGTLNEITNQETPWRPFSPVAAL